MKTLRKLVYGETLLSIALITGGFLTLKARPTSCATRCSTSPCCCPAGCTSCCPSRC
jgi:hypothetical protein